MKLQERRWREQMSEMVGLINQAMEAEPDSRTRIKLIGLRERLAGCLGADEGVSTTGALRIRASNDYQEAARLLKLTSNLDLPQGGAPKGLLAKRQGGFGPAAPKHGDHA